MMFLSRIVFSCLLLSSSLTWASTSGRNCDTSDIHVYTNKDKKITFMNPVIPNMHGLRELLLKRGNTNIFHYNINNNYKKISGDFSYTYNFKQAGVYKTIARNKLCGMGNSCSRWSCERKIIVTESKAPEFVSFSTNATNNRFKVGSGHLRVTFKFKDENKDFHAISVYEKGDVVGYCSRKSSDAKVAEFQCSENVYKNLVRPRTYKFNAKAWDKDHNASEFSPTVEITAYEENTAPVITLNVDGSKIEGTNSVIEVAPEHNLELEVTATDIDDASYNRLSRIELDVGAGYKNVNDYSSTCTTSGKHISCKGIVIPVRSSIDKLRARAIDAAGSTSEELALKVSMSMPPEVSISASKTTPFINESIQLTANASAPSGLSEYYICAINGEMGNNIKNGCTNPIHSCNLKVSECKFTLPNAHIPSSAGLVTYYAYAKNTIGVPHASKVAVNYSNYFGVRITPPGQTFFTVGQQIVFNVNASAFDASSTHLTSLALYKNGDEKTGSRVTDNLVVSPAIDSFTLPKKDSRRVTFEWSPTRADAATELSLTLVAIDNNNNVARAHLPNVRIFDPTPATPSTPSVELKNLGSGAYGFDVRNLKNMNELVLRATLNGRPYPLDKTSVSNPSISYSSKIQTTVNDHGKYLQVFARGHNWSSRGSVSGAEGSSKLEKVINIEQTPHTVFFNSYLTQSGGPFILSWPANSDGVTDHYKVYAWPGLPSDRGTAQRKLLTKQTKTTFKVTRLEQGHYTYELQACNSQGTCSNGQQLTVEHVPPYIDSATVTECAAADGCKEGLKTKVTLSGVGFDPTYSNLYIRLRKTGSTYAVPAANLTVQGSSLTGYVDDKVFLGLLDGGVDLTVTNGVVKNQDYLSNTIIVDETGSQQRPKLTGREFTVSELSYLYTGADEGMEVYRVRYNNNQFSLQHIDTYSPEAVLDNAIVAKPTVDTTPLVSGNSSYLIDKIYVGSLNNRFYHFVHDPKAPEPSHRLLKKWTFQTMGEITAQAKLDSSGALLVGSMDEALYSLDRDTGLVNWHYDFPNSGGVTTIFGTTSPDENTDDSENKDYVSVVTLDEELHTLDHRVIGANGVNWQQIEYLSEGEFKAQIESWERTQWHPSQDHTYVIGLTKVMYILLQKAPSKAEISFAAYLMQQGHPFNEIVNAIINVTPSLSQSSNAEFIATLFDRLLSEQNSDRELTGESFGVGNQRYWTDILDLGVTRAEVVIDLLGSADTSYDDATYRLLYHLYKHCLVINNCHYDYDSDGDGLSNALEDAIGTNSGDSRDGLVAPKLTVTNDNGALEFTLETSGMVDEYQLFLQHLPETVSDEEAIIPAVKSSDNNLTTWIKNYGKGTYLFKARACVSAEKLQGLQVSRCGNNFSDEFRVEVGASSIHEGKIQFKIPNSKPVNHEPSRETLLEHATIQPTVGSFRVTESGAASYTVPINLPAGITGVQPEVSLNYNSQGGDGLVALGWSLSATSSISRCRQTKAQDGQFRGLTLSDEDRFCLDGQRLVSVSNPTHNGQFGDEQIEEQFVTEIDSYMTIYRIGSGNQSKFVVLSKDGSVKQYGASDTSKIQITDSKNVKHTMSWMLSDVKDNLGDESTTINYHYTNLESKDSSSDKETVLDSITYSGFTVKFDHSAGELRGVGYIDEARTTQFARLNGIKVHKGENTELAKYVLTFGQAGNGARLLKTVEHCRADTCRAPINFNYEKFGTSLNYESFSDVFSKTDYRNAVAGVTMADLKASGRAQLVTLEQTDKRARRYQLCIYQGVIDEKADELACTDIFRKDDHESVSMFAIDHDQDGKQTLLINMRSEHSSDAYPGYWAHYSLSDNDTLRAIALPNGWSSNDYMREIKPADMDGDGYADLVYKKKHDDPDLYVRLWSTATDKFEREYTLYTKENNSSYGSWGDFTSKGTDWHVIDMNFDGLADIVSLKCKVASCSNDDAKRLSVHYNQGTSHFGGFAQFLTKDIVNEEKIEHLTPSDVNGDGLVDLIFLVTESYNHNVKRWRVLLNQSSERVSFRQVFQVAAKVDGYDSNSVSEDIPPMSMDVDRNGRLDLFFKEKKSDFWRRYQWSVESETFVLVEKEALALKVNTRKGDFAFFSDYDGDGLADIIAKHEQGVSVRYNLYRSPMAGMLLDIEQGYRGNQNKTQIKYGLMSDDLVYSDLADDLTADSGRFNSQNLLVSKVVGSGVLVQSVTSDSPSNRQGTHYNEVAKVDYHYQGARVQFGGRGALGFKTLKTTTQKAGVTFATTTRYHQAFPLTGMPYSTEKRLLSGSIDLLLDIAVNEYATSKRTEKGNVLVHQVYNSASRECSAVMNSGYSVGAYNCTNTTTEQDNYGNVKNLLVNTHDVDFGSEESFAKVAASGDLIRSVKTSNDFGSPEQKRLGRLLSTEVVYSGQGLTPIKKSSRFEYYPEKHAHENMLYKEIVGEGLGCNYELTTEHTYDKFGNKIKVSSTNTGCPINEQETRVSETIYDSEGRYVDLTKQSGSGSELFLKSGQVLGYESGNADRNVFGQPINVKDSNGVVTKILYDDFGEEIGSYSNTGAQAYTYYSKCADGDACAVRLIKMVNGEIREKHLLDKLGRVYSISKIDVLDNWHTSTYEFDQYGRNDVINESGSQPVIKTFDALDRVVSVVDNNNGTTSTTSWSVSGQGRETTVKIIGSGIDQEKTSVSNAAGQTIQVIDSNNQVLDYVYNALGAQVTVTSSAEASNQRLLSTIRYDKMGRKSSQEDADRGNWSYIYNAFGELVSQTDARKVVLTMQYDFLGRKIKQTQEQLNGITGEGTSVWQYGETNKTLHLLISSTQGSDWQQNYFYDEFGRAAATSTSLGGTTHCANRVFFDPRDDTLRVSDGTNLDPIASKCVIQQNFYDKYSRLALQFDDYRQAKEGAQKYIEARGVAMTYQNGQLLAKTEARDGDDGQIYYKVLGVNHRGQVTSYMKGNVTMEVSYDQKGMVTSISSKGLDIQRDTYSFDSLGNLISRSQIGMATREYHYDDLNRVLGVNDVDLFKYSATGNLIEKADYVVGSDIECAGYGESSVLVLGRWTQNYGQGDTPLHAISSRQRDSNSSCLGHLPAKTELFEYDANGNQIKRTTNDDITTIKYSARNKAIEIQGNGETVSFSYDANNRRFKRMDAKNTVFYVGALELTIPHNEEDQSVINRYIGNDAQQTYYSTGISKTKWMFTDHQGSTIAITNDANVVLARYAYDVFGKQREVEFNNKHVGVVFDNITDNLRAYTGHEPVSLGGDKRIIHMNGRVYDSDTGRFMQADPFVQAPSNLQNYNAYSYVLNNPLSYTDPSGYLFKKLLKVTMKITGDWYIHKFLNNVPWLKSIASVALNFIPGCQVWCTAVFNAKSTFVATGSLNGALKAGAIAAASAYAFSQIGDAFGAESGFWQNGGAAHVGAHALTGGIVSELQGGKFGHGFFSAGLTKGAQIAGLVSMDNVVIGTAQSMVISGTISQLTGGKFANAAVTGAFQYLYNARGGKGFAKFGKDLGRLFSGDNRTTNQKIVEYAAELMDAGFTAEEAEIRATKKYSVSKSVKVSHSKHPETAKHIEDAQAAGHPQTLTINRAGTAANRKASLRGVPTKKGYDRDEYPPAMFEEGGSGASVRYISPGDNRGAGSSIGAQCRGLACGTKVNIEVVD
ncbi:hypothetical protein C3B51_19725 [Pseudoalteromonas rubra]|uniref:Deoxyribonuclease NucA/NucB domain-containing protein n=1 Tax=Pseudoalteromonas rubra TaxID=43658 RepID=A0A4Q7E0Y8_9GAMM|nr:SpvB/TcaC N-terminal domain-containing protein [Pseudoalteromonas rubra]RZM74390.1 hypothetical protein C3B51_19725 [Pseudoalteromonas rubra]